MYIPIAEDELRDAGYLHECGNPYKAGVHDADGRCFRWVQGSDGWEASLYLLCSNPACEDSPTSYVNGRLRIDGKTIAKLKARKEGTATFLEALRLELEGLFDDFRKEISTAR